MSKHPYLTPVDPSNSEHARCQMCDEFDPNGKAAVLVSSPADTGPFTDVEESTDLYPTARWDTPLCNYHAGEMLELVTCNSCHTWLFWVDAMTNGSTVTLCRPCNARENAGLDVAAGTTLPQ